MRGDVRERLNGDGFVVLEGFISDAEADRLRKEGGDLVKNMPEQSDRTVFSTTEFQQNKDKNFLDSWDKISYFFESGAVGPDGQLLCEPEVSLNKIGHALHELNDTFREFTFDERIKETCFQLGLAEPAVVQSMYIFKNPGIGGVVAAHQDASFLYTEPENLVGFWVALEDATLENGCLWFARGSHKGGGAQALRTEFRRGGRRPVGVHGAPTLLSEEQFYAGSGQKGTCVLIHGQVVHYSEANKSEKSRHVYTFHVVEQKDTKYAKENWLQPTEDHPFMSVYKN